MAHDTTMLAQVRKGSPSPPLESLDKGHSTGRPRVEVEGQRFRVQTSRFSTEWLPDTPSNRHTTVVWLRLLVGERGRPLFTLQELAALVGSDNRQAASQHLEDFRQCGEDFRTFVLRKRKVDGTVVEAVLKELLKTPLAGPTELVPRVNAQLGRDDVTAANIDSALEQISCVPVLKTVRRQLEVGHVQYREAYLLAEMLESVSPQVAQYAGAGVPRADRGMKLADPTALTALVTPDLPLQQVPDSLCWLTFIMTLFYWNVPLSVLGRWWGVHKTTILRWVLGLALALWPIVSQWLVERVKAQMVYVWVGCQLRRLKKAPQVIITDGLPAYAYLVQGAKHILCRFHHQQGVTRWLKQHFTTEAEINTRKTGMKKVFQTQDKRTVRRRLARLREQAPELGITTWVTGVEEKLPRLICSVGSVRLPSTTNAIERFFRAFQRFYTTRGGFHSVRSAKRELLLFVVVYLFTQRATDAQAPIEVIVPEARRMPLYRLINDPFRALQERGYVKEQPTIAELLLPKAAAD